MRKLILISIVALFLTSCGDNGGVYVNNPSSNVVVTPDNSNIGDNLNLQALGELVKSSKDAKDIEAKLNTAGSINNLDLDNDGKVDYIKVTEYGDANTKGFSFTVQLPNNEKQEVATVEIQKNANTQQANMNIQGNQQVYGNNNSYSSNYSFSDLLIMSYLFSPHTYYASPWGYGYYPSYYHSYGCASYGVYSSRMRPYTTSSRIVRTTTTRTSSVRSPNSSYSSNTVSQRSRSLMNSTRSQKSFSATSNSRPSTNGFGNRSSSRSSSGSSFGSSSRSSSFGSSSRASSSRSFGSSSRSSSSGRRR